MYYKITEYFDPIGQKQITDKCPDCGNQNCLELHFYQKRIETPYSKKVTKKVTGTLFCHHTQSEISPVLWSDYIEKKFKNEKTQLQLNPTSLKFNKWFFGTMASVVVLIVGAIGYSMWENNVYNNQSIAIENAAIGDAVKVIQNFTNDNTDMQYGNTWYKITAIDKDTMYLQQHKDFNNEDGFDFDLEESNFNGEIIKASQARFKERLVMGFDYSDMKFSGYITEIK